MCWRSRVSGGHYRRWLHIDEESVAPSNKQAHLISNEFFRGTDLLKRPASVRRKDDEEAMESLTTSAQPSYGIQTKNSTRPNSSGKLLQLTPLWEHIVKNNQLPPETDKDVLFAELAIRLCDLEWEVRGHALRVLLDLIPVLELSELDSYMMPVMLKELVYNLGHSAPSVRKGALDTLGVYLTHSTDPETVLRHIVSEGLEKQTSPSAVKGNIAMGVILSIPSLVNPLLTPTNGIVLISQTGLIHLVSALSKKIVHDTYQEQSLKTLVRIREMVGEARFDRFLEGFHPQCKKDFDILCQVYDVTNLGDSGIDLQATSQTNDPMLQGYWSESSSAKGASSSTVSPEDIQFRDQNQNVIYVGDDKSSSSDNLVDSSPSPKEELADELEQRDSAIQLLEEEQKVFGEESNEGVYESFREVDAEDDLAIQGVIAEEMYEGEKLEVAIEERAVSRLDNSEEVDGALTVLEGDPLDEEVLNSGRVILETEIKFNEDAAIMMTILEEGNKVPEEEGYSVDDSVGVVDNNGNVKEAEFGCNEDETAVEEGGYRVDNNDYVMKVLTDDEDYNDDEDVAVADHPIRRTPRRVRFGGEMVMMRTPDSDEGNAQQEDSTIDQEGRSFDQEVDNPDAPTDDAYTISELSGETNTETGAIQAVISDSGEVETRYTIEDSRQESEDLSRRDSLVSENVVKEEYSQLDYTDNVTLEESRQELLEYERQDTLDDAKQIDLVNTRRDSFKRQDTVIEMRQDSLENAIQNPIHNSRQNSLENGKHSSIQEFRQNSLENGKRSFILEHRQDYLENSRRDSVQGSRQNSLDYTRRTSIQDSFENNDRFSIQESRQDSAENRLSSIQELRQDSADNTILVKIPESRRDSLENTRQNSVESRRDSVQDIRQGSLEGTRRDSVQEIIPEIRQDSVINDRRGSARSDSTDSRQQSVDDSRPAIQYLENDQAIHIIPEEQTIKGEVEGDEEILSVQSHIPLPVTPAKSIPRDHKKRGPLYRKRQKTRDSQTSSDSQQSGSVKGGSISGSEGDAPGDKVVEDADDSGDGNDIPTKDFGPNWEETGIVNESVLDDLHDQVSHQDQPDYEGRTVVHICAECACTLWEMLMSDEWVSRIHGIETLSAALKDPEVLHTVMPCMPSLLHCLLVTMAEDRNYRVATSSLGAVRGLINSLPHAFLQDHLQQIVVGLTRHIGGSGSVNLKIETAQVAKNLMLIMKPNPVIEILLTPDCIGAKSSKMRENSLLFLIYATLTFPSTEFHWDRMTEKVATAVADPRRRVRLAALDALSVIAQFATPSLLDEAVRSVAERQPNYSTRIAYLAGIQARLARRQLPTTSQDGLILYVLQIPSARTSGKGSFSTTPIGSDVDWVLSGSGSLSSGSARSRAQLIAAQRLDPHVGIFPPAEETPTVTVKSRWTERKGIVAPGVQSRAQSASLTPIKNEKKPDEPRTRTGIATWTTDLGASNLAASQSTLRPQILRIDSPPDVLNLNNDSVEKGSFSLLPNRLTHSTLVSRSEGVGQEHLNQTWPPPASGRHSPRIPKKTSSKKRGRRILEPLNGSGSPRQGISPISAHRGTSPLPKPVSPIQRSLSPGPKGISSSPRGVSPVARGSSPMRRGSNSSGRHKIPPLSPRKKKEPMVTSGFHTGPNLKDDDIIDLASLRKARRRKRSTNRGKGIIAIEHGPTLTEQEAAESVVISPPEAMPSGEQQTSEHLEVPTATQE